MNKRTKKMRLTVEERVKLSASIATRAVAGDPLSGRLQPATYYSARMAQDDLDRLTIKGAYVVDGDTFFGYEIRHVDSGKVVVRHYSVRDLVLMVVDLWITGQVGTKLSSNQQPVQEAVAEYLKRYNVVLSVGSD